MSPFHTKTVVVLGGAYGGARAAQLLASQLGKEWKLVLIDKNSHANHVYILPRVGVLPGHEHKAFVPYTRIFNSPDTTPGPCQQVFIQGTVTALTPTSVTFVRQDESNKEESIQYDFCVYALGSQLPAPVNLWGPPLTLPTDDPAKGTACCETASETVTEKEEQDSSVDTASRSRNVTGSSSRCTLAWLWRKMPWPLGSAGTSTETATMTDKSESLDSTVTGYRGTKVEAISWLRHSQKTVESAGSVLVVGGGALGIQFATDIASIHPTKEVTLIHSREHLLPRFDLEMHSEALLALQSLGVDVILNDRVILDSYRLCEKGGRLVRTRSGREIRADLIMLCTGQKPNTQLISKMDPSVIPDLRTGLIKVKRSMQVEGYEHIFAAGDVADAFGAIQAGHTAYWQAGVASRNIIRLIKGEGEKLEEYAPGPPAIKVTLGLKKNVTQTDGVVVVKEDGVDDLQAKSIWSFFGYKVERDEDMYD